MHETMLRMHMLYLRTIIETTLLGTAGREQAQETALCYVGYLYAQSLALAMPVAAEPPPTWLREHLTILQALLNELEVCRVMLQAQQPPSSPSDAAKADGA